MDESSAQAGPSARSLWRQAPGWRGLTVAAALLTLAAAALPLTVAIHTDGIVTVKPDPPVKPATPATPATPAASAGPQPQNCMLVESPQPTQRGSGTVVSFEDHTTSLRRIERTQASVGGQIDPDYIANQRAIVRVGNGRYVVFIVPKTMQVHLGDRVLVQNGYRNINLPCNYIPQLITADLGASPDAAADVVPPAAPAVQP
jgi:hypothetical protein